MPQWRIFLSEQGQVRAEKRSRIVRALVGPGIFFTGWQIMSFSFWCGACLAYCGFVVCLWECATEPALLNKPDWIRIAAIGVLLLFFDLFSINMVFVLAPIDVSAYSKGPAFNLNPGGIDWKPSFSELDVVFANQTDMPYENFNVLVRPNVPVAGMAQIGNLPDVSFRDRYGIVPNALVQNPQTNETIKAVILATDAGYSVSCKEIPAGSSLQLVMQTIGIKPTPPPSGSIPQGGQIAVPSYVRLQDFYFTQPVPDLVEGKTFHYWLGNKEVSSIFVPNVTPNMVTVRGTYIGGHRSRSINQDVSVKRMDQ
jgi:hypothetical protein